MDECCYGGGKVTKIKDFFKHIVEKFKQNWRKILLWSVLLFFAVCGMVYSWTRKNKGEIVSGSADEVTSVTFRSAQLEFEPLLAFNTSSVFRYAFQLVDTVSYFTITKNFEDNSFLFSYDTYNTVENIIGNGASSVSQPVKLMFSQSFNFSSLYATGFLYGSSIISNASSYNEVDFLIRYLTLDYVGSSAMSNAYSRVSSIVDYDARNIENPKYTARVPLFISVSSFAFDPSRISYVDTLYTPIDNTIKANSTYNMFELQMNYAFEDYSQFFTQLQYKYVDLDGNSFSIYTYLLGNHFTENDGSLRGVNRRYIAQYNATYYDGYNDGYIIGEQNKQNAVNEAYTNGKNAGYNLAMETLNNNGAPTFLSLIDAVGYGVTKPFVSLLNFDLLGVNMLDFATSILTIFIVVKIITLFV